MTDVPHMKCAICHQFLDTFRAGDDERQFIHSRVWEEYDHEPEPVEPEGGEHQICDFCFDPPVAIWNGNEVSSVGETGLSSWSSGGWCACKRCDALIKDKKLTELLARVKGAMLAKEGKAVPAGESFTLPEWRRAVLVSFEHKQAEIRHWLPTIRSRESLIKPKIEGLKPAQLARVADRLVRFWVEKGGEIIYGARAGNEVILPGQLFGTDRFAVPGEFAMREHCDEFADLMANGLTNVKCYWISREFTARAVRGSLHMKDLSVTREDLPARNGFMYFDSPIYELPLMGAMLPITAVSWMTLDQGVWFTTYARSEASPNIKNDQQARIWVEQIGWFTPWSPGGGAKFGQINFNPENEGHSRFATMLSVFMFINTERVTDTTDVAVSKSADRKARKAGIPAASRGRTVTVVDIRRKGRQGTGTGEARGPMTYQMEISGHPKMQFYGPGRALRKRIWVDPYWKGPEDAPVRFKGESTRTVEVLR